jgi:hypothetical protein
MPLKPFLISERDPRIRYEVISYDPETEDAVLRGPHGLEFGRNISKAECKKWGYKRTKLNVNDDDANVPDPPRKKRDSVRAAAEEAGDE